MVVSQIAGRGEVTNLTWSTASRSRAVDYYYYRGSVQRKTRSCAAMEAPAAPTGGGKNFYAEA
jgi:hypothetical protein